MDGYAQGLETSDSAEELCRRLMTLYQRQGRRAEALALSRRRRATLVAKLGIARTRDRCAASRAARRPMSLEEKNQSAALREEGQRNSTRLAMSGGSYTSFRSK